MRRVLILTVLAFLSLFWIGAAEAGVVFVDKDGTRTLVSEGKVKSVPPDSDEPWTILDFKAETIMLVDPQERRVAKGTIDSYCQAMQGLMGGMGALMQQFGMSMDQQPGEQPEVEIVRKGSGGRIAGYETTRYQVLSDGEVHEELWIAEDASLMRELGSNFGPAMAKFNACAANLPGAEVEDDPAYQKMVAGGWPLKTVSHSMGEAVTDTEYVKVEKADLPESEFAPPASYKSVTFSQLFGM